MSSLSHTLKRALVILGAWLPSPACAYQRVDGASEVIRMPWTSIDESLARIELLPPASSPDAPLAVHVLCPEGLSDGDHARLKASLQSRGYEIIHNLPDIVVETTSYEVRLALAEPFEILDVPAWRLQPIAVQMWIHDIPWAVRPGSWVEVVVPRRAEARVRSVLDGIVPRDAWRASQHNRAVRQDAAADDAPIGRSRLMVKDVGWSQSVPL